MVAAATTAIRWTPHEDSILRERYRNTTVDELSLILGRSPRSVLGRITRLGLKKSVAHKWSASELAYLRENRGKLTHAEMASVLGVPRKSVSRAIERYEIQQHRIGLTDNEAQLFERLHSLGYSDLKISRQLKLTKSRVLRYRLRIGVSGNGYTDNSWSPPNPKFKQERRAARKAVIAVQLASLQRELEAIA